MGIRTVMATAIAIVGLAQMVAACGLTADFSGLQGGTRDGGGADVAVAGDAAAADGGADSAFADAGVGEGAPAGDGGGDSGADAGRGFCASLTTPVHFCDDFDEGQPLGAGWDAVDVYQGSNASIDYTYFSPPASFLSQIASSTGESSARLQKDLPIGTPHVHFEFDMLVPPANGNFQLCVLHEPVADGTTYGLFYKLEGGNLMVEVTTLEDDGGVRDEQYTIGPPPSGWLHVQIDADLSSSATIVVRHGTTVVVNQSNVNTLTTTRASMFMELGYYSFQPATTLAHFDNVIVDWQ